MEEDQLDATIAAIAAALLGGGPHAQAASKTLIRDVADRPLDDELCELTACRIADLRATPEAKEGLSAFLDKRAPLWRHRPPMFDKILIANRGEIACRIIKTARRMGMHTVAVYSEADAEARHVAARRRGRADRPGPGARKLSGDRKDHRRRANVRRAGHPSRLWLSLRKRRVRGGLRRGGIVFIGPPAGAIRAMGSKIGAKKLMERPACR